MCPTCFAYAPHQFRICGTRVPHMRWSSGAYAPHAFRICAGALAHMRRSVPHMTEISDFGRRCDFKSQCNMSFGTIQTHYQHRTTTACFYRRTFEFLCSGYALELWRICGTAVPHMRPTCSAYAAHAFRICAPCVPHMRPTRSAYAVELFRICGGGFFRITFSVLTLS